MNETNEFSDLDKQIQLLEFWVNQSLSEKKQILNHLLVQDQQAQQLYCAAHDIRVVIKNNRMVTQQKLLAGLTQWSISASIGELSDQQKEVFIYSYLCTAVLCEILKEIIWLESQTEKDERRVILHKYKNNNKINTVSYNLKLLLQKQFSNTEKNKNKLLYKKVTLKLQATDEFNANDLKTLLERKTIKNDFEQLNLGRYIQQFIIVCNELINSKLNSTAINVQALINDIKKGMTYKSDSGTSSFDLENDDNGQDTEANVVDPEQDEIAKREKGIFSDDQQKNQEQLEKQEKRIQRRDLPYKTNPLYLKPSLLHQAYQLLQECYQEKISIDPYQSSLAVCGLMCLLTGLSPTVFQKIEDLIESGRIKEKSINKVIHYYWVIDPKLNANHSGAMREKTQRYNQALTLEWRIPEPWITSLKTLENLERREFCAIKYNNFLREVFKEHQIGEITCGMLERQIYFHMDMETGDNLIAHLLANRDTRHIVQWNYEGRQIDQIDQNFQGYINVLLDRRKDDPWVENEHPGHIFHREKERIGSQRCWTIEAASEFFNKLYRFVKNTLANAQANRIEKLNAYSIWMWHLSLICLTVRPIVGMPGLLKHYDPKAQLLYVHDKKTDSRKVGRPVPVTGYWQDHFNAYRKYLTQTIESLGIKSLQAQLESDGFILYVISYPRIKSKKGPVNLAEVVEHLELQPMSADFVTHYLKETVQIYKNWPRHFTKNHLDLSGDIHNTLYAHDKQTMGFSHISGLSPYLYKHDIQQQVESLLNELEIAKLEVI
ncbi:Hemolysin-type calcium binding protein [Acinetobacter sp. 8I-beige]|uniref:hypothetical protein n=1 Tax=Acinetobacter sp. 8I-beige TaxID=2653125 RepID=UPI0012F016CA|nr:hypothetical protein [Acinetobacter sp. 8I-beige]VXA84256.1 Hemolysin-type calcium binding protein [Acinetobacter sp. 8I-beige]